MLVSRHEVWQDDEYLIIELDKRGPKMDYRAVWVEFVISKQHVGPQGFEREAVAEGFVHDSKREFGTIGMYDGDLMLLHMAVTRAYAEARKLMEEG